MHLPKHGIISGLGKGVRFQHKSFDRMLHLLDAGVVYLSERDKGRIGKRTSHSYNLGKGNTGLGGARVLQCLHTES